MDKDIKIINVDPDLEQLMFFHTLLCSCNEYLALCQKKRKKEMLLPFEVFLPWICAIP